MKTTLITATSALVIAGLVAISPAHSDEAPTFIQDTFPAQGVEAAWQSYQAVFLDPDAALDAKTKELIALGVSAQVPCSYCIYYHARAAEAQGASEAEIQEALASAALVRKWSTMLNGSQYDEAQWRSEVDAMFSGE
jgi:AhpD family alkylhydroperoxidase